MSPAIEDASVHWEVSARDTGELLTAHASVPGLELRVLGLPEDFTAEETAGWLRDIIEAARGGAFDDPVLRPIPALLHHALLGLLFSHAALWNRDESHAPGSLAIASAGGEVGFGWVGDIEARVELNGEPIDIRWVSVRDEAGREARAWSVEAGPRVEVRFTFPALARAVGGREPTLEVRWAGVEATTEEEVVEIEQPHDPIAETRATDLSPFDLAVGAGTFQTGPLELPVETETSEEPLESEVEHDTPATPARGGEPLMPAPQTFESPSIGVARWLERALGASRAAAHPQSEREAPVPAPPDEAPPEREASAPLAEEALEAPPLIDDAPAGPTWWIELPPGVPDRIPPTPEPSHPSAGAAEPESIRWPSSPHEPTPIPRDSFEPLDDPRAIRLPPAPGIERVAAGASAAEAAKEIEAVAPTTEVPTTPIVEGAASAPVPSFLAEELPARTAAPAPRRAWPVVEETRKPLLKRGTWWVLSGLLLGLFAIGWLLGSSQGGRPNPLVATWRALGLGGPRFDLAIASKPSGASIAVDGASLGLRTPAEIDLAAGTHQVTLSFLDLGAASYTVHGTKRERSRLEAQLDGSLEIVSPDPDAVIAVAVDGEARGFAPVRVEGLAPGAHEVRFSGPGMASWGQTVEIKVHEQRQIFTRPLQSPATGLIQIRATRAEEGETKPLQGARVWLDGQPRGATPITLELPRGPHSVRVSFQGEEAPVQVIDLPGGNQRFATFEFGLDTPTPRLVLRAPAQIPAEQPVVISAALENVASNDLREMWLNVRAPDGRWRRYPMSLLEAEGAGAAGAIAFPSLMFGSNGKTAYYVSALTGQGDEYFTEIQNMRAEKPKAP